MGLANFTHMYDIDCHFYQFRRTCLYSQLVFCDKNCSQGSNKLRNADKN